MKYFISFLGTAAPIFVCLFMGIEFIWCIGYNGGVVYFNKIETIVWCFIFFISFLSPFKFGQVYRDYYYNNKKQKEK